MDTSTTNTQGVQNSANARSQPEIESRISQALDALESSDKYVILPTKVGYTVACWSEKSTVSMFEEKGRSLDKPAVFLLNHDLLKDLAIIPSDYQGIVDGINEERLLCSFVLNRKPHDLFDHMPEVTNRMSSSAVDNTSSFAINAGIYTDELTRQATQRNMLIVCSSANKSGVGNEGIFSKIPQNILDASAFHVEDDKYVLQTYSPDNRDRGPIIRLANNKVELLREGLMMGEVKKVIEEYEQI